MNCKKIISFFSTTVMVLSSAFSSWGGVNFAPITYAVETSTDYLLDPGVYIAPLYQCRTAGGLDSPLDNEYQHFNGRAKLEVTEDGKQIVTIGVENWDFYEAFVPMNQEYNLLFGDEYSKNSETSQYTCFRDAFPEKLLTQLSENGNEEAKEFMQTSEYCTSKVNDFFKYGDIKYGDIMVDTNTNHSSDTAYVSFEINDYREEFYVAAWANRPGGIDGYEASRQFILNYADMYKADVLEQAIESNNVGFRMLLPSARSKTATDNPVMYFGDNVTSKIFDSVSTEIITDEENNKKIKATYHVNDSYPKTGNFVKLCGVSETEITDNSAWSLYSRAITEQLTLSEDRYLTIEYDYNSIDDLIFGEYIYFENTQNAFTKRRVYFGQPVLAPKVETYELLDENTGVKVSFKNSQVQIPENILLNVEAKPIDGTTKSIVDYGYLNDTSNWYKIELIDTSTREYANFVGGINIDIPLPENLTSENRNNYITKLLTIYGELESTPDFDYAAKYWHDNNEIYADGTLYYFVMNLADNATEQVKNLTDGIYSAEAFLFKSGSTTVPTYSMANGALIHEVYIVVKNGKKKMYFKAQDIGGKGHLGEILCNDTDKGSAYYDSITYTKYDTFEDGSLISNAGYDPINEWACIEGGILTLMDDSYYADTTENAYYHVAIVAPPMAAMGGMSYDEVEIDDLGAKLQFSNVKLLSDVSEEDVIAMFPYDKSALLRKIKQTEINFAATLDNADVQKVLTHANEVYTATYVSPAETSHAYEAEINTLTDFAENYDAKNYLSDGRYLLNADMFQIDRATKSMSDNAINHTVTLDVVNGEYYVNVEFKGLTINDDFGYLSKLSYYDAGYTYDSFGNPKGTVIPAETLTYYDVVDEYNTADSPYPHYLRFKLVDKASGEYVPLQVFVPIMEAIQSGGGTQNVLMKLDWSTLKKAGSPSELNGHSISLSGDIGLNFFLSLSDEVLADSGAKLHFTLPDGSTEDIPVSSVTPGEHGYQFTAHVAAKEMTSDVTAQVLLSDGTKGDVYTYSVKQYADTILADEKSSDTTKTFVKAMLNYGGYAQVYFNYNTSNPANADLTDAEKSLDAATEDELSYYEYTLKGKDDGISYKGSKLSLESETAIKHYFALADGKSISDYTFKVGGNVVTPVKSGDMYYITVENISAQNLGTDYTVQVGKLRLAYSPMSYAYSALTKTDKTALQDVTKALYLYNQAADNYINS